MITPEHIKELANQKLIDINCFIVDVKVGGGNNITVMIDKEDSVSIEDCVLLSKYIEQNLDREKEDFELNVMSAGLSEPFKVSRQYVKNIGNEVEVTTPDNKKVKGLLLSADESGFEIEAKTMERVEGKKKKQEIVTKHKFNYNHIKSTKLVLSF